MIFSFNVITALLLLKGSNDKVILAAFEFSHSNISGDIHRLSRINFSTYNKAELSSTGGNRIAGEQFAGYLLKIKPQQPKTYPGPSQLIIPDTALTAYAARLKEQGYSLTKTFYPDFETASVNQTMAKEADAVPGKKNFIIILVKDSFDVGDRNYLSCKVLGPNGKILWSQASKFGKLLYDKKSGFYKAGYAFEIPAMPANVRTTILFTYYDKEFLNRPVYGQLYIK